MNPGTMVLNIPGVTATQNEYWKLGFYNPWNRKCEVKFEDEETGDPVDECGIVFTKDPVAERPRHASMEHRQYPQPDGDARKRCNIKRKNPYPSGICNHCYIEEFSQNLEDQLPDNPPEPWVPINPKDPQWISILSRIDATPQEKAASTKIILGEFYEEKHRHDGDLAFVEQENEKEWVEDIPWNTSNEGTRYYDQVREKYNLPPFDYWFEEGLDELQAHCFCTHRGKGEDGLLYKWLIFDYKTRERLFLGSECVKIIDAKKVCVNCQKPTNNWKDPWCNACRKLRCHAIYRETRMSARKCDRLALDPSARLLKDRLCERCTKEGKEEWVGSKSYIVRKSQELREEDEDRETRAQSKKTYAQIVLTTEQVQRIREEQKIEQMEQEMRCNSCGTAVSRDRNGNFYPECFKCSGTKKCSQCNIKWHPKKFPVCYRCHQSNKE
tara:strand:+ start:7424 stop:8743 length:1320 start_codon:yes stop_codon:yes gene_type:complete